MFNWQSANVLGVVSNTSAAVSSSISNTVSTASSTSTATATIGGTSTQGPSTSATASSTASSDDGRVSKGVPIGVGVGIGVPMAVATALFAGLWANERRKRIAAERHYNAMPTQHINGEYGQPMIGGAPGMMNVNTAYDPPLHSHFAEADDSREISELSGQAKEGTQQ